MWCCGRDLCVTIGSPNLYYQLPPLAKNNVTWLTAKYRSVSYDPHLGHFTSRDFGITFKNTFPHSWHSNFSLFAFITPPIFLNLWPSAYIFEMLGHMSIHLLCSSCICYIWNDFLLSDNLLAPIFLCNQMWKQFQFAFSPPFFIFFHKHFISNNNITYIICQENN